jgi:transcriptional regulator with XRE-family HTH domain
MASLMPSKAPLLFPMEAKLLRHLGERIREARLRRRFSVLLVAARCDVSRPTINKVEDGSPNVTLGTYLRVLAVLGLEKDLETVARDDVVGRRLQDAGLRVPRRAPKRAKVSDA